MSYCHAVGPAGLPLELACLQEASGSSLPAPGARAGCSQLVQDLLGWQWPEEDERLLREGLSEETLASSWRRSPRTRLSAGRAILAGIEAVRLPEFGIDITPETLDRYLAQADSRAAGVVASWNLLDIPEENLRALGRRKRLA